MADNEEWELPGKKGKKAMKEAAAAKALAKEKEEAIINQLRQMIHQIYMDDNPAPEIQNLMITSIETLKSMGEDTSRYTDYETDRLARLARIKAEANQMAKNKADVNAYFRTKGKVPEEEFEKAKISSTERVWGRVFRPSNAEIYAAMAARIRMKKGTTGYPTAQPSANEEFVKSEIPEEILYYKFQHTKDVLDYRHRRDGRAPPTNANVYSHLAKEIRKEEANREAANRRAHREWRASMEREYPDWYNYGTAAQGGPAPRAQYVAPPPAMYPILEVPVTASIKNITKAYREKAVKGKHRHPNKGGDEEEFKKLDAEYRMALEAAQEGGRRRTKKSRRGRSKTRKNRS